MYSINTTTALTEVPIVKSKADFILINGKAVVYEIKTELDNFERLDNQISDYYKVFDHVAVVTCNENVELLEKKIENLSKPVGTYNYLFSEYSWNEFTELFECKEIKLMQIEKLDYGYSEA